METQEATTTLSREDIEKSEKKRLISVLANNVSEMIGKYNALTRHSGGLLQASMSYAYERALLDAVKLLTKEKK